MAFVSQQTYRVQWYFALGAFRACSTRTWKATAVTNGGPGPGVAARAIYLAHGPALATLLNENAIIQGVVIQDLAVPPNAIDAWTEDPPMSGVGSLDPLPPQVAGRITLTGGALLSRNKGRIYIPFASVLDNDSNGRPTAEYQTKLQDYGDLLLTPVSASDVGGGPPPVSRAVTLRCVMLPTSPLSPNLVISTKADSFWGTQRRRATPPYVNFSPFG